MKFTVEDVQLAIKGMMKDSNTCISEKLLAVVAGNYAQGNTIITLRLQSLYEDENFDSTIGEIKNLYYTERDGRPQLRGDVIFDTERLDIQSLIHSLANGCVYLSPWFMNIGSLNHSLACLSEVTLSKAEDTTFNGIEPLDISDLNPLINALYKEQVAEAQESNVIFHAKYDHDDSGLVGYISSNSGNKIHFNENSTVETKDGYLIIDSGCATEAIRVDKVTRITSAKHKDGSESVYIYSTSGCVDISHSTSLNVKDVIKILERYKESQIAALKISCS
ncbi:TPA: hypothetical protein I8Y21_004571 [Klebsiella oxytoca]|uniref:Uncharacterized protein n=1 Tax=Klebsiella oxytoca TaxID=571 RepID=A0AAN5LC57_KLEOX|nr:hypothetical protein [Klebsiella oxytoca]